MKFHGMIWARAPGRLRPFEQFRIVSQADFPPDRAGGTGWRADGGRIGAPVRGSYIAGRALPQAMVRARALAVDPFGRHHGTARPGYGMTIVMEMAPTPSMQEDGRPAFIVLILLEEQW